MFRNHKDYSNSQICDVEDVSDNEWHTHPAFPDADIAVIPLHTKLDSLDAPPNNTTGSLAYTPDHFLHEGVKLTGTSGILCYPGDFVDRSTYYPIMRNAVVASHYGNPFNGRPYFITDARMHDGTSGSPVLLTGLNVYKDIQSVPDDQKKVRISSEFTQQRSLEQERMKTAFLKRSDMT